MSRGESATGDAGAARDVGDAREGDERAALDAATLPQRFRPALGLLTDLYQVTMAYAHHRAGTAEVPASFSLSFRRAPFGGAFAVAAGIDEALDALASLRFAAEDVAYLATLRGADGEPLFDEGFLQYLAAFRFRGDVEAVLEGTVVHAHEPLVRVTGPVLDAQLVETLLLNVVNFQTLVATKAARMTSAAAGRPVVEFGLRRAQGVDGGLSASRAAYLGGAVATSNVLAGRLFGIPVRGTHAHAWVQFFDDEREAFARYREALAGNVVYLVDTYATLEGVRNAVREAVALRARGKELVGIRLDSGDLDALARASRALLDEAGLHATKIYASNDLDEHAIAELVERGAPIDVFGVGTRLVTGGDQAALGGVYKLTAVAGEGGRFVPRMKLSEDPAKASLPGRIAVARWNDVDVLYDLDDGVASAEGPVVALRDGRALAPERVGGRRELLAPAMRAGRRVRAACTLEAARDRARAEVAALDAEVRALDAGTLSAGVPVAVTRTAWDRREALRRRARGERGAHE